MDERPVSAVQDAQAQRWETEGLLKRCTEDRQDRPAYIFYEGPPTANGQPGIHHVLARTLKDSVNRYWTMKGYYVPRKAGWDTHGLPVEIEVEKELGFFEKGDIERYGIAAFNQKCRESVFKYEGMWREMSRRMGFMADMDHPYITLDNDYIETGWWILKRFFDEGLIYEGYKILPYCPRCGTGLASHEVSLGYKEIVTQTVTAAFRRKGADDEFFLAWTTTPWTLASNVSLTVGPEVVYVRARILPAGEPVDEGAKPFGQPLSHSLDFRRANGGKTYWVARSLADRVLGEGLYEVIEERRGAEMEGMEYEQLIPFVDVFAGAKPDARAFFVTTADYVGEEDGTGIVHSAPAFGEDDYQTGRRYGLAMPNPVDENGKYTMAPWKGRYVTDDDLAVDIIKWLAEEGKLFRKEKMSHNYPHCWRCGTPLIYYAKPSWYIEMTKLKDELVKNNDAVRWFPDFVGEKRFGNWLENVNDWAISRTRYWGTPIPIWRCPDCGALTCVGSRAELAARAQEGIPLRADGVPDIELHRPYVDEVTIRCDKCGGAMRRIPEVIDCWFDSGSMPYAQQHYPFEHAEDFYQKRFPADFICEGIDQTRGWFYSLMCISTFIEKDRVRAADERGAADAGRAAYRNCLVGDLILDKNGEKMSKSKGNTVDPFEVFDKYGADAVRWYLLAVSPAWAPTKFDEKEGLTETAAGFFGTLRNVYKFFALYANQDGVDPRSFEVAPETLSEADRWIRSRLSHLVSGVRADMDVYDHMHATRRIQEFVVEDLSNWYIRRSRRRFWGEALTDDKRAVYRTAWEALVTVAELMAPFAPFISDEMYRNLGGGMVAESIGEELHSEGADAVAGMDDRSVHLADFPVADEAAKDPALEERMETVRRIVSLGRGVREKERIKVRQPLPAILLDGELEPGIGDMQNLICEELNVKKVCFTCDTSEYFDFSVKPDFRVAGKALGPKMKDFAASLAKADAASLTAALAQAGEERVTWSLAENAVIDSSATASEDEIELLPEYVDIQIIAREGYAVAEEGDLFVVLDTTLTPELIQEGLMREFISKVQQTRKNIGLEMMDRIEITYEAAGDAGAELEKMIEENADTIMRETLADKIIRGGDTGFPEFDLNGRSARIGVEKR